MANLGPNLPRRRSHHPLLAAAAVLPSCWDDRDAACEIIISEELTVPIRIATLSSGVATRSMRSPYSSSPKRISFLHRRFDF